MKPLSYPATLLMSCALLMTAGLDSATAFGSRDLDPSIEIHLDVLSNLNADKSQGPSAAASGTNAAAASLRDPASPFGPGTPPPAHQTIEHTARVEKAYHKTKMAAADRSKTPAKHRSATHNMAKKAVSNHEKPVQVAESEPLLTLPNAVNPPKAPEPPVAQTTPMSPSKTQEIPIATPLAKPEPAASQMVKADIVLPVPLPPAAPPTPPMSPPAPMAANTAPPLPIQHAAPGNPVQPSKKGMFSDISRGFSDVLSNDASAHSDPVAPVQDAKANIPPPAPLLPINQASLPNTPIETAQNTLTPLTIPTPPPSAAVPSAPIPPAPIPPAPPMAAAPPAPPIPAANIPPAPPLPATAPPPPPQPPSAMDAYSGATPDVSVPFTASQTDVPLDSTAKLDILAQALASNPSARATIVAYASGPETTGIYPKRVSLARGIALRNYLTTTKNIDIERVNVKAMGNKNGGGPGDRVDIFISK